MSNSLVKSLILFAFSFQCSTFVSGALVDTEGNSATNQTLLGDIDMGVGTLWDLKQFIFPYDTNAIPYSALSGTPDLSSLATKDEVFNAADQGTNYADKIAREFEDGTREVDYASDANLAFYLAGDDDTYNANDLIRESTNAANHSVSELVRTNSVLSGGP